MKPAHTWNLNCPWCTWYIIVNNRGMRRGDPGSGVEAAGMMERHMRVEHTGKTWDDFLKATVTEVSKTFDLVAIELPPIEIDRYKQ